MNFSQVIKYIQSSIPQEGSPEDQKWLDCEDALRFLVAASIDQVPIYISAQHFFLYAVLVPKSRLRGNYVDNILCWDMGPSMGWGYGASYETGAKRPKTQIIAPLDHTSSSILDGGEALVFLRSIYNDRDSYLELNQRLAHVLGIHKISTRGAYCKVDEATGDLVDIVPFCENNEIMCIDRKSLNFYMSLTDTVLIQLFNVTRWHSVSFSGWHDNDRKSMYKDKKNYLFARLIQNKKEDGSNNAASLR